jgi:hypothetical protein
MIIRALTISLLLFFAGPAKAWAQQGKSFREKLITYLEAAKQASEAVPDTTLHRKHLDELYILGTDVAADYFEFKDETEFDEDRRLLKNVIVANQHLRLLFIPLGNALIQQARKVVRKHDAEVRHYRIAAALGGLVLGGLAGASYQLVQKTSSALRLAMIVSGGALGSLAGYFLIGPLASDLFIEFDLSVEKSEDFILRYPYASQVVNLDVSQDLLMALDELEVAD